MIDKDTLWKAIIEDLIDEFLRYFFPDVAGRIDFGKGFQFLDKELEQLSPPSKSGKRHADKLIQAWLIDGEEQWFLIHVEIQGYRDVDFAGRMFQYAYRIKDRYGQRLAALAIFTDADRTYHTSEYRESFMGTEFHYKFRTFSLVEKEPEELLKATNIFGLALAVARRALGNKRRSDWDLLAAKTGLVRYLYKWEVDREKIKKLLIFIKFYTNFEEESFFQKFDNEIQTITKSRKAMGIEEAVMNELKTKAEAEGLAKGMQKGLEKGLEKGLQKGLEKGLEKGMNQKEHIVVARGLERGLAPEDIAFLADMPLEKVLAVILEIREEEEE